MATPSLAHPGPIWTPGGPTNDMDIALLLARYGVVGYQRQLRHRDQVT